MVEGGMVGEVEVDVLFQGIDNTEVTAATVSYRNGQIMVEGATDDEVVLYDIMRRRLAM